MSDRWPPESNLPTPMRNALTEFESWMQGELLADQARSTPNTPLYHYTGEAALRGILEHGKPWCFSHNQQSDDTEVQYSFTIARKIIQDEAARGNPAVKSILTGLDGILDTNPLAQTFGFYFFSLSSHRDHARQWAKYGDCGRGFALGFAPTLFRPDKTDLAPAPNENVFVGKIIYGDDETAARHHRGIRKMAEIVTRMQKSYPHLVRGQNLQTWFDVMNKIFISMLLIWNCLTAKSEGYRDEQETRYIIMGLRASFDGIQKQHNERNYIETPLSLLEPGKITEIIVGPDAPADAEVMVMELLQRLGYPADISVTRSANSTKLG